MAKREDAYKIAIQTLAEIAKDSCDEYARIEAAKLLLIHA